MTFYDSLNPDEQAAYNCGVADERERIHHLALTEAQRLRGANFSTADPIAAAALEDFAELLQEPA